MAQVTILEDAGVFQKSETEIIEPKRRFSIDRIRKTSLRRDSERCNQIIISPEDVPDEYEQYDEAGLMVIFNHEKFNVHDDREGTYKDQEDLIDCFTRLRFEVRRDLIFNDLCKEEIEVELQKIASLDHSKRNSIFVVFLTHGNVANQLITSDGSIINCEDVWNFFSADKCRTLIGKPKIFIFQACKGKSKSVSQKIQEDSIPRSETARKSYTLPAEADILVAYSTVEGNVSYRHPDSGTWYIQELCKNITAYGRRDDLATIITRVSKCVAYHYAINHYKQMPCFLSTLTRKFYLSKSKERGFLLELRDQHKELLKQVDQIRKELQELTEDRQNVVFEGHKKVATISPIVKPMTKAVSASRVTEKPRWK